MIYNTLPKRELLSFFASHPDESFSLEEIASALPDVGKSTVYRLMAALEENKEVKKVGVRGRSALYQHVGEHCAEHMHLRCLKCGRTEHLDDATTKSIEALVEKTSGFLPLNATVLDGVCSKCREKEIC